MEKNFLTQTARAVNFTKSEGSPVGSDGNESAYNVGDSALIPGSRRPPGEGHEQRGTVGCSPWNRKESDTTEWLSHTLYYTGLPQTADVTEALWSRQDLGSPLRGGKNLSRQGNSRTSQGHEGINSCGIQATMKGDHQTGAELMMGSQALNLRKGCDNPNGRGWCPLDTFLFSDHSWFQVWIT